MDIVVYLRYKDRISSMGGSGTLILRSRRDDSQEAILRQCVDIVSTAGCVLLANHNTASRIIAGIMNLTSLRSVRIVGGLVLSGLLLLSGCQREKPLQFTPSEDVQKLSPELQQQVNAAVEDHSGTALHPKMLGVEKQDVQQLKLGQSVYMRRCVQCHGVSGDGNGPVAATMYPRPRDYRKGIFKFTSTPYGAKPRREDLVRTVTVGVPGTSMPKFELLPKKEIDAVIEYVLMLTHRGELEFQLAAETGAAEEFDAELVPDLVTGIKEMWGEAASLVVTPMTPEPIFTEEHVRAGKEAFLTRGCSKCHGEDGRGQTVDNLRGDLKDTWGHVTRAADLTSGMLHGGRRPEDIYRRIYSGINGTPMPGFSSAITDNPQEFWNLVAFVQYISSRRRSGRIPTAPAMDLNELIEEQKKVNEAAAGATTTSEPAASEAKPAEEAATEEKPAAEEQPADNEPAAEKTEEETKPAADDKPAEEKPAEEVKAEAEEKPTEEPKP